METATVKKQSNRKKQGLHATYKSKSEIGEALNLLEYNDWFTLAPSTIKVLKHYGHTQGSGVTQIKVRTLCEKVGISKSAYYDTVKPQIEEFFDEPLIITINSPKKDKLGRLNPNGSKIKALQPLWKIKYLVEKKVLEIWNEGMEFYTNHLNANTEWFKENTPHSELLKPEWLEMIKRTEEQAKKHYEEKQLELKEMLENGHTSGHTSGHTPEAETPCESKDEGTFQQQQNKSFREKHLEKDFKNINNNTPPMKSVGGGQPKIDLSKIDSKTFELLNSYKNFIEYPFYLDEQKNEDLRTRIIYWVQMAINKAKADINKPEHQHVIKEAVGTVINHYDLYDYSEDELTKLLYTSVKEILEAVISGQRETAVTSEKPKKKSRSKYAKKPIRTEMLPNWFDEDTEERYGDKKQSKEAIKEDKFDLQMVLAEMRQGQAQSTF